MSSFINTSFVCLAKPPPFEKGKQKKTITFHSSTEKVSAQKKYIWGRSLFPQISVSLWRKNQPCNLLNKTQKVILPSIEKVDPKKPTYISDEPTSFEKTFQAYISYAAVAVAVLGIGLLILRVSNLYPKINQYTCQQLCQKLSKDWGSEIPDMNSFLKNAAHLKQCQGSFGTNFCSQFP